MSAPGDLSLDRYAEWPASHQFELDTEVPSLAFRPSGRTYRGLRRMIQRYATPSDAAAASAAVPREHRSHAARGLLELFGHHSSRTAGGISDVLGDGGARIDRAARLALLIIVWSRAALPVQRQGDRYRWPAPAVPSVAWSSIRGAPRCVRPACVAIHPASMFYREA